MSVFVQEKSGQRLGALLPDRDGDRTLLAIEFIALLVAGVHHIFEDMSYDFVRQVARDVFRAMVPEKNSPFAVDNVNPDGQTFDHTLEQLRVVEQVDAEPVPPPGALSARTSVVPAAQV